MCLVPDQGPVEQLVAAALDPALHDRVHAGLPDTAEHDLDTVSARIVSNWMGNLPSRSRMRHRAVRPASSRSMARFRPAWVTRAAVGCAVASRIRMRRLACSMTART